MLPIFLTVAVSASQSTQTGKLRLPLPHHPEVHCGEHRAERSPDTADVSLGCLTCCDYCSATATTGN